MTDLYYVVGIIVVWGIIAVVFLRACLWVYDHVWQKIKTRTWAYQIWETFMMWFKWDYRRQDYKDVLHWNIVEHIRKKLEERPHVFKGWWRRKLDRMLDSPEYKKYKEEHQYDNDTI